MRETTRTEMGRCCTGHGKTRWCTFLIVAAGIGVWLFPGDARTMAADECAYVCPATDCNGNGLADSCDVDCGNTGDFCGQGGCDILSCVGQGCGYSDDCNLNGVPDECEPDCDGDGVPDECESKVACCLTAGCSDLDPDCCTAQGGTSHGAGTSCGSTEACCFADSSCSDLDPVCCDIQGGVPGGPGTSCADFSGQICSAFWGCCNPSVPHPGDFECPNHTFYTCVVVDGGQPIPGVDCDPPIDGDGDGVHDLCDPCPNSNPDDADGDLVCDDVDNCSPSNPLHNCSGSGCANPGQEDCDDDFFGDVCEPDCDGDTIPDDCDPDIDGDGIFNLVDICDYTPQGLTVDTSGVFIGSVRADLDGDCDVDALDRLILDVSLNQTGGAAACVPGPSEDDLTCPVCFACDSCCPSCGGGPLR